MQSQWFPPLITVAKAYNYLYIGMYGINICNENPWRARAAD